MACTNESATPAGDILTPASLIWGSYPQTSIKNLQEAKDNWLHH